MWHEQKLLSASRMTGSVCPHAIDWRDWLIVRKRCRILHVIVAQAWGPFPRPREPRMVLFSLCSDQSSSRSGRRPSPELEDKLLVSDYRNVFSISVKREVPLS